MKKIAALFLILLLLVNIVIAQSPQKFSFQGVARDSNGKILSFGSIVPSIRFTIHKGSANGTVAYDEIHTNITVSAGGVFNLEVGGGNQIVVDGLGTIEWDKDSYFLQVQCDFGNGAVNDLGAVQLLSVPYAQHATTAASWIQNEPVIQVGDLAVGSTMTSSGEGPRLIWYPRRAAFRIGLSHDLDQWSDADVGRASFASGEYVRASGFYSAAFGVNCHASGSSSLSAGYGSHAMGSSSFAMGSGVHAKSHNSTALGIFNDDTDSFNPGGASPLDRLFPVGNGSEENKRSNAFTVLRNGNVGIGNDAINPTHILDIGGRVRIRYKVGSTAGLFLTIQWASPPDL